MTALDAATTAQRRESLRIEREVQRALETAYKAILARLQGDLDALTTRIAAAQAAGETVNGNWLAREERYRILAQQTEAEIARFGRYSEQVIANGQRQAATVALSTSEAVMAAALGTPPPGVGVAFNRLPTGAIEELVGNLGDGRPLSALLSELVPLAAKEGRRALVEGIGKGLGPRAIAKEFRLATNTSAVRALLISRTEINRVHRESALANFRANSDTVTGWKWCASGSSRTCGACFAKHGTVHKLDEAFESHPACRCTPLAITKSWSELGFGDIPDTRPQLPDRDTLFGRLSEADQRSILGSRAFDLWQAGEIALEDFATPTHSRVWGGGIRQTRLYELERIGAQEAAD